jgi:ferric-dicitrate binding protein FerR (iron transport regulator)
VLAGLGAAGGPLSGRFAFSRALHTLPRRADDPPIRRQHPNRRGGLNLGALLLALMVAMGIVWWGQAQGDVLAGGARARKLRSTDVD